MRILFSSLLLGSAFSGLARPIGEKRSYNQTQKKQKPSKGWDLCASAAAKASYLYLKPQGYLLGSTSDRAIASDGGWAPGIGLALGLDIGALDWRIDLEWHYSYASPYQSVEAGSISSLINAGTNYTAAEQWLDMKINRALILWSCEVNLFDRFLIRPKAGTEAIWLHQKRHLRYSGAGVAESFGKNSFSGFGSVGGLGLRYHLGGGFAWVGDSLFSLVWGHFNTRGSLNYSGSAVEPTLHLTSGLEWQRDFSTGYISIGAVYEVHHYFSQGQSYYEGAANQPINTDFNVAGPSLYARVCF